MAAVLLSGKHGRSGDRVELISSATRLRLADVRHNCYRRGDLLYGDIYVQMVARTDGRLAWCMSQILDMPPLSNSICCSSHKAMIGMSAS